MSQGVIHYPRLDTVFMIEDAIRKSKDYPKRMELWRSLPKKTMYQTFMMVLKYLEASNKIMFDKDGSIVWIFVDNPKLKKALKEGVRVR
ncbi:MAG: hypothetical protein ABH950_01645 [Candidatus Altiarchaeota archaeon]